MISQSPISDPGYSSNASTPWLDKEECERFPEQKHTLLEMDTSMDSTISDGPNSPSPPPTQAKSIFNSSSSSGRGHSSKPSLSSSHNYGGHEQQMSMSTRRTAAGLLPLSISTANPPTIHLDLAQPASASSTSFYDSGTYWL
jgi:hypothetical protein